MEETEEDFSGVHVLTPGHEIEPSDLPTSARKLGKRLYEAGWSLATQSSTVSIDPVLYATSDEEKGYTIGDVRYPGYEATNYWVRGYKGAKVFTAWWITRDGSTKFVDAVLNMSIAHKVGQMEAWLFEGDE